LIGDAEAQEMARLNQLVTDLNLNDRVHFTGKIERDNMPAYLCHAKVLALARPSSLQSLGGFPTKLGEYLATGNPVVVTKVGEIPSYLRDGENAYLAEPDSPELFAAKLEFVLSNYETAKAVGKKGSELVKTYFNYRYQSKRILEFVHSL
jgi:glycosyltransferase involved in cell wall biosynthesis